MESVTLQNKQPSRIKFLLLGTLITLISCVFPLGLLITPAFYAYAMYRTKPYIVSYFGVLYLAAAFVCFGRGIGLTMTALLVCAALLLYVLHQKKVRTTTILMVLTGAAILILYCAVCLPGILSGEGAFAGVQAYMDEMILESRETVAGMAAQLSENSAELMENFDAYAAAFSNAIPALVVPVISSLSIVIALSNLLFFRLFSRKTLPEIPRLPAFSDWKIPNYLTGGLCFLLVASLALELFNVDYAIGVSATVNVLVGTPLMLQGLAFIDFIIKHRAKHPITCRVLAYLAVGLLFSFLRTALMLLGCMEQLFHYRERIGALPPRR